MDRILKILKKENGPRASSAPALELNTIMFKHVYWYMQQISGERLQDHWSSGFFSFQNSGSVGQSFFFFFFFFFLREDSLWFAQECFAPAGWGKYLRFALCI